MIVKSVAKNPQNHTKAFFPMKNSIRNYAWIMLSVTSIAFGKDMKSHFGKTGEEKWRFYQLEDKTKLKFEEEISASSITPGWETWATRLYHYSEDGVSHIIWEENLEGSSWELRFYSPSISSARRFGDVFCVAVRNAVGGDGMDFLRVDTSQTPHAWLKIAASTPGDGMESPTIIIESPHDFRYEGKGKEQVAFRVFDDGRLERNGIPYKTIALVNGKLIGVEGINEPKPPPANDKHGGNSRSPEESGSASKLNASAPVAIVGKAGESTPLPGGWALWAGIATLLAAAAGWLLLRSKRKKR